VAAASDAEGATDDEGTSAVADGVGLGVLVEDDEDEGVGDVEDAGEGVAVDVVGSTTVTRRRSEALPHAPGDARSPTTYGDTVPSACRGGGGREGGREGVSRVTPVGR
jgi:hypothetical protein